MKNTILVLLVGFAVAPASALLALGDHFESPIAQN